MKTRPYTMLLMMLAGWMDRQQQDAINYFVEQGYKKLNGKSQVMVWLRCT